MSDEATVERVARAIYHARNPPTPLRIKFERLEELGWHKELEASRELARAAIAALPPQGDGWQDIATAPRDGTEFTGYELVNDRPRILSMVYDSVFKGFVASVHSFVAFQPTHWRPLPAPPAAALAGDAP